MAERIGAMRALLVERILAAGSGHDWSHVSKQIGMFAFTGMSAEMCDELTEKHAIYLTRDGRISIAGVNPSNVEAIAAAVHQVTRGKRLGA